MKKSTSESTYPSPPWRWTCWTGPPGPSPTTRRGTASLPGLCPRLAARAPWRSTSPAGATSADGALPLLLGRGAVHGQLLESAPVRPLPGIAAKTDALDAQVITRFAQASRLEPKALSGSALSAVRELLRRRESLVEMVKAETCRGSQQAQRVCLSQGKRMVALLKRQIAELEKEIRRIVAEDADLANKVGRLASVKGIGWLTAATALAELPDLGTMGPRQAAAMAGLAPFARDSGKSFGKRHVSGGNFHLRKALYMPAQCAKTHNAHLRAFYLRLRENGKPFKVAITAVMRKMIVLMNRLLADPNFQPSL